MVRIIESLFGRHRTTESSPRKYKDVSLNIDPATLETTALLQKMWRDWKERGLLEDSSGHTDVSPIVLPEKTAVFEGQTTEDIMRNQYPDLGTIIDPEVPWAAEVTSSEENEFFITINQSGKERVHITVLPWGNTWIDHPTDDERLPEIYKQVVGLIGSVSAQEEEQ